MENQMSIEKILDFLGTSIIYQMSLNSHELFHSNLWAWLIEQDPIFAKLFFPDLDGSVKPKREEGNRDITVWKNKRTYVIENKFKSIPTEEQLIKYEKKFKKGNFNFVRGVLTGIKKPSFCIGEGKLSNWSFLSYDKIAEELKRLCEESQELDLFTKTVVNEYADMISLLCKAINDELNAHTNHVPCFTAPSENDPFSNVRLRDLVIKMHADAFCSSLRNSSEYKNLQANLPAASQLILESGFSRKSGIVDICYQKGSSPKSYELRIGVQIQGKQFKLFVSKSRTGAGKIEPDDLFQEFLNLKWFENYTLRRGYFKERPTKMSPTKGCQFDKYLTASYCFVYQYFDIPDDMDDAEVERLIWEYLEEAKQVLKNLNP